MKNKTSIVTRIMAAMVTLCMLLAFAPAALALEIGETYSVSFVDRTAETYQAATLEADGWEFDSANSTEAVTANTGTILYATGFQAIFSAVGDNVAFKFTIPEDGNYKVSTTFSNSWRNTTTNLIIDGNVVGSVNFQQGTDWTESPSVVENDNVGTISLRAGEHTLVFSCTKFTGDNKRMFLRNVGFEKLGDYVVEQNIVFEGSKATSLSAATIAADGWALDAANSDEAILSGSYTNIYAQGVGAGYFTKKGEKLAFKFNIEEAGVYDVTAVVDKGWYYGIFDIVIDGVNLGKTHDAIDWSKSTGLYITSATKSILLAAGEHTIAFAANTFSSDAKRLFVKSINFKKTGEYVYSENLNFVGCKAASYADATIAADGWALDTANSSANVLEQAGTKLDADAAKAKLVETGDKIAFKFNIKEDGAYSVDALVQDGWYCTPLAVAIDGVSLGKMNYTINWSSYYGSDVNVENIGGRTVNLKAGEHTVILSAAQKLTDAQAMVLKSISFTKEGDYEASNDIVFSFTGVTNENLAYKEITYDNPWKVNAEKTTGSVKLNSNGTMDIFVMGWDYPDLEVALDFYVADDGMYSMSAIMFLTAEWYGDADILFYVDGRRINEFGVCSQAMDGETAGTLKAYENIGQVALKAGMHTLVAEKGKNWEGYHKGYFNSISFEKVGDYVEPTPIPVSEIVLDKTEVAGVAGDAWGIAATVKPFNADNMALTWSSDNEEVAIVVDGVITAVAPGNATITVASVSNPEVSATVTVTVNEPAPAYEQGDVNGDGKINTRDVTTLRRYLAGGYEDSITFIAEMIDVNGDGRENTRDVAALRAIIAG